MYNLIPEPKTFAEADRQSKLLERASAMASKGYKAVPFATSNEAYYIDGGREGYVVYLLDKPRCSCPDFARHGDCCKHLFFAIQERSR